MELLGPATEYGLDRVHLDVEVTVEGHFPDNLADIFLNTLLLAGIGHG